MPNVVRSPHRHLSPGEAVEQEYNSIVQHARTSTIAYRVPPEMKVDEPQTVTVRIVGPSADTSVSRQIAPTGSGNLKVVPYMKVTLSEPANPGVFKIAPDPSDEQATKFVPDKGFQDWRWTVTPIEGGDPAKQLHIAAYIVIQEKLPNGLPAEAELESYDVYLSVQVKPRAVMVKEWVAANWKDLLSFILPSGAVTTLAVFLFMRKRQGGRDDRQKRTAVAASDKGKSELQRKG